MFVGTDVLGGPKYRSFYRCRGRLIASPTGADIGGPLREGAVTAGDWRRMRKGKEVAILAVSLAPSVASRQLPPGGSLRVPPLPKSVYG